MMRKHKYYSVFLVLILILGLIPWIDGFIFKKKFLKVIEVVNKDDRVTLEVLSYKQGWFRSKALVKITLTNDKLNQLPQINIPELKLILPTSFLLEENISHGPFTYDNKKKSLKFGYAHLNSKLLLNITKSEIIQVDTFFGFDGNWSGQFYTSNVVLISPAVTVNKISIENIEGDFELVLNKDYIQSVTTNLKAGPIFIEGNEKESIIKHIIIQPIKSKYDANFEKGDLWSGNSSTYTPGVSILKTDGFNFVINKLAINTMFSMGKNIFYNMNLAIYLGNISSPNFIMPTFSKTQMIISAKSFNLDGLNDYLNLLESKVPEQIQNLDMKKIDSLLANTIRSDSTLVATISSDTSLGEFSGRAKSSWPETQALPNSIQDIVDYSKTKIHLKMSESLVAKMLLIYSDKLLAGNDAQLSKIKQKTEMLEKEYYENQQASNDHEFNIAVNELLNDQKITLALSMQILNLEQQHQPLSVFSRNLDQLNLDPATKKQLISLYQAHLENMQKIVLNNKMKQLLSDLSSIGYLVKDNETNIYSSKLVIDRGVLKIYGSPVFAEDEE